MSRLCPATSRRDLLQYGTRLIDPIASDQDRRHQGPRYDDPKNPSEVIRTEQIQWPEQRHPCPGAEMPKPVGPGKCDRTDAGRVGHCRVIVQIEQEKPCANPADHVADSNYA